MDVMGKNTVFGYSAERTKEAHSPEYEGFMRGANNNRENTYITYEDYGAIGDGVADDSEAIRAAHNAANEKGLPVLGRSDALYRIGYLDSTINVMTNTDWNGALLIFDDRTVHWEDKNRWVNVFTVISGTPKKAIEVPEGLALVRGQENVGMTFDKPCLIKLENEGERIYMRYGENANGGVNKNEMILVDEKGNVDPSTPIQYDYATVTKITVYSIDDEPVYIGNGRIKTIVPNPKSVDPDYENHYCYYGRGISAERSNTTVYNITHSIEGEDMTIEIDRNGDGVIDFWGADKSYGVPYAGFFGFRGCYNSLMTDCLVQGHQAYSFYQGVTRNEKGNIRNEMGSYDITANDCVNISFKNLVQYENEQTGEVITNRKMYHGVMGSNFCRNVTMDNCYLDRFDSHQGLHNARITNCTLGFGILVIGGGELYIENVYRIAVGGAFVHLRMDYNSYFDGDVILKNCRMGSELDTIVIGRWVSFYNGLPNYVTRSVTVDGLVVDGGELHVYNIREAVPESVNDAVNKLYLPEMIRLTNVTSPNGVKTKISASKNDDALANIEITME